MAVEKALSYDDREEFRRGGRSRRGGAKGGRRGGGGGVGGRSRRGGARGGRRSGSAGRRSAQNRGTQGRSRRGTTTTSKAVSRRAAEKQGFGQFERRQKNIAANKTVTPTKKTTPKKTTQAQTRRGTTTTSKAVQKAADKINRDFNERTAFKTKSGDFLRDSKGNIVRSKTQVDRFKDDKRKQDIARKLGIDTTLGAAAANPNLRSQEMTPGAFRLSGRLADFQKSLGKGEQTRENLNRLAALNRELGVFPYTGMGILNQLRTQSADLMKEAPALAKIAGFAVNPALALATGGQGILGLGKRIGQAFGFGAEPEQMAANPNLRAQPTNLRGQFADAFKSLRIGEDTKAFDPRDTRGGRRDERAIPLIREMAPPMQPTPIPIQMPAPTATALATGSGLGSELGLDRLQEIYQLPRMMAQDGGRVHMGHGGMMMSESPTVIMNVANSGIGGILDKFKQIRSEI